MRSYDTPGYDDQLDTVKIWEACRATSAAISYFTSIEISPTEGDFSDGGLRENNPISRVWEQAMAAWPEIESEFELDRAVKCIVSIGTGLPAFPENDKSLEGVMKRLQKISLDTQEVAEKFVKSKPALYRSGRYNRFDVDRGWKGIKLDDVSQLDLIINATKVYLDTLKVQVSIQACADRLADRQGS